MRVPKFLLPEIPAQVKCQVKCPKGKKPIVATKLPKLQGSEERENRNCGNQVAKNGREKKRKRKKELWQPSCRNLGEEFNSNFGNGLWEKKNCGN